MHSKAPRVRLTPPSPTPTHTPQSLLRALLPWISATPSLFPEQDSQKTHASLNWFSHCCCCVCVCVCVRVRQSSVRVSCKPRQWVNRVQNLQASSPPPRRRRYPNTVIPLNFLPPPPASVHLGIWRTILERTRCLSQLLTTPPPPTEHSKYLSWLIGQDGSRWQPSHLGACLCGCGCRSRHTTHTSAHPSASNATPDVGRHTPSRCNEGQHVLEGHARPCDLLLCRVHRDAPCSLLTNPIRFHGGV